MILLLIIAFILLFHLSVIISMHSFDKAAIMIMMAWAETGDRSGDRRGKGK